MPTLKEEAVKLLKKNKPPLTSGSSSALRALGASQARGGVIRPANRSYGGDSDGRANDQWGRTPPTTPNIQRREQATNITNGIPVWGAGATGPVRAEDTPEGPQGLQRRPTMYGGTEPPVFRAAPGQTRPTDPLRFDQDPGGYTDLPPGKLQPGDNILGDQGGGQQVPTSQNSDSLGSIIEQLIKDLVAAEGGTPVEEQRALAEQLAERQLGEQLLSQRAGFYGRGMGNLGALSAAENDLRVESQLGLQQQLQDIENQSLDRQLEQQGLGLQGYKLRNDAIHLAEQDDMARKEFELMAKQFGLTEDAFGIAAGALAQELGVSVTDFINDDDGDGIPNWRDEDWSGYQASAPPPDGGGGADVKGIEDVTDGKSLGQFLKDFPGAYAGMVNEAILGFAGYEPQMQESGPANGDHFFGWVDNGEKALYYDGNTGTYYYVPGDKVPESDRQANAVPAGVAGSFGQTPQTILNAIVGDNWMPLT